MLKNLNARHLIPMSVLTAVLIFFAACASGSTSSGNNGGSTTTTGGQPTTVVKTKPTGPVKVDQPLCDRLISKAEAGQITQTTVVNVRVIATDEGGSCNYETAPSKSAVTVTFLPGGTSALQAIQSQLKSQPGFAGTITPIANLGDAAIAVVNPIPGTSIIQYRVIVADGAALINCILPKSTAGDTVALDQLKQVATLVLDRL